MKITLSTLLLAVLVCFASCDEGRIPAKVYSEAEKGRVAVFEGQVEGLNNWPSDYNISVAGFSSTSNFADAAKNITVDSTGYARIVLSGIPDEVTQIEVCVLNSIRKRIATFYTVEAPTSTSDTIRLRPETSLNVGIYALIQSNIFDKQCANCHSGNPWAASLNLGDGMSHSQLVGVASHKVEGKNRVTPGDATNSVLYEALSTDISVENNWKYNHSNIFSADPDQLNLIKDWINNGAKQ